MQKELSYLTPDGHTVFTSQFLKNRGTCCRTTCLHCPYGFTIKKCGISFKEVEEEDHPEVERILIQGGASVAHQSFLPDNIKFVLIKGHVVGLILKNHIVVKHLVLLPHFQDQNISKELVESYYFI